MVCRSVIEDVKVPGLRPTELGVRPPQGQSFLGSITLYTTFVSQTSQNLDWLNLRGVQPGVGENMEGSQKLVSLTQRVENQSQNYSSVES